MCFKTYLLRLRGNKEKIPLVSFFVYTYTCIHLYYISNKNYYDGL